MSATGNVPVLECVRASYSFLGGWWRAALAPALVVVVADVLLGLASISGGMGLVFVVGLAALAANFSYSAAVLRVAVGRDSALRLRLGADEARLFVATVSIVGVMLLVLISGLLALGLVLNILLAVSGAPAPEAGDLQGIAEALGTTGEGVMFAGFFLLTAAIVFVLVRLFLVGPATIAEQRVMVFATWTWTKGSAWRLLGATVLSIAPALIGLLLLQGIIGGVIAGLAGAPDAPAVLLSGRAMSAYGLAVVVVLLRQGLAAYVYRGLRPAGLSTPGSGA
ncbi:MAG: hypothetical protein MI723_09245 [Caulobacterales bacterium]|nr:hypothetical protein [Caulobacterales bacterium]